MSECEKQKPHVSKNMVAALRSAKCALLSQADQVLREYETSAFYRKDCAASRIVIEGVEDLYGKAAVIADWLARHFPVEQNEGEK